VREALAWILTFYWRCQGTLQRLDPILIKDVILPARKVWTNEDFYLETENVNGRREAWIECFDTLGRMKELRCAGGPGWRVHEKPMNWLLDVFNNDTSKIGLLRLAGFLCAVRNIIPPKSQSLSYIDGFHDTKYRLSAMIIRMSQSDLTRDEAFVLACKLPEIVDNKGEPQCLDILMSAIERHMHDILPLELFAAKLIDLIPQEDWQLSGRAFAASNAFLQRRISELNDQTLGRLRLPLMRSLKT
jgi:hypothetical protein